MKIGVNTRLLLPGTLEGIGRFTHEVLQRLVATHPEDEFYFFFDRPWEDNFIYGDNVNPISLSPQSRHPVLWYWWFEKSISKALASVQVDVFFSPELYCCLTTNAPTMMVAHDVAYAYYPQHIPYSQQQYLKYFVPRFLQKADRIACVSDATQQDLVQKYQVAKEKLLVAHNGPTPGFQPLTTKEKLGVRQELTGGAPFFLYIGSMHPRKNIGKLLEAYNKFRKNNPSVVHKLVLVGRMAWKSSKIKRIYETSPYRDDIILTGQRDDAHKIMGAADALVYVSLLEGFGIPIIEAFSCDTPVITSNLSSMPEVAGDGALLVDPKSKSSIAGAMQRISYDPEYKTSLVKKGRKELERFSWDRTADLLYQEISALSSKS